LLHFAHILYFIVLYRYVQARCIIVIWYGEPGEIENYLVD